MPKTLAAKPVEYRIIKQDGVVYYGKHLILTAKSCNDSLLEKKEVARFLTTLVDRIQMVAFGKPIVERFGAGVQTGLSAVQLIETSAIMIHTNDQARDLYLDVFSCKTFCEHMVTAYVKTIFNPSDLNYQVLMR